jgi:hypothetical protein
LALQVDPTSQLAYDTPELVSTEREDAPTPDAASAQEV